MGTFTLAEYATNRGITQKEARAQIEAGIAAGKIEIVNRSKPQTFKFV